jgi:cell division ATPase FtsA
MKLPFLQASAAQSNKFLSVNINSKDVKCLTLYYDSGSYKIIGFGREALEAGSVRNSVIIDKEDVVRALKSAVLTATENLEEKVNNAIIGVSGDLCLGLVTTVRFKRQASLPFEKEEIDDLYEKISESAKIQAQNEYLETTGNPEVPLEIITSSNVFTKVDGQAVDSLEGGSGSAAEAAVFNAFSPSFHIRSLQDIAKKAGLNILAIGSEMYAISHWLKQYSSGLNDFVLLSIDNESTNAAVVFGGGIVSTKSLNIGFSSFTEGLSEKMGVSVDEADKMLKGYIAGKLTESEAGLVQSCVNEILNIWLAGLEILFNEFSNVKTFAPVIYLTGYGAEIKDVIAMLKSEPWTKSIPFGTFPEIFKVNFSDFSKISDATGKVGGPEWLNNISMSIIYEEIFGE